MPLLLWRLGGGSAVGDLLRLTHTIALGAGSAHRALLLLRLQQRRQQHPTLLQLLMVHLATDATCSNPSRHGCSLGNMLWRRHRTPITSGVPSSRSCPILKGWYYCTRKVTATIVVILDCTVGIRHCSDRRRHLPIQVGDTVGGEDPGQHSPGAAIAVPVAIDVATTGSRVIPEEQAEVIFVSLWCQYFGRRGGEICVGFVLVFFNKIPTNRPHTPTTTRVPIQKCQTLPQCSEIQAYPLLQPPTSTTLNSSDSSVSLG